MINAVCFQGLHLFLDATQVSYRFLELEPGVFCEQWDWSCFLDLVYSTADYSLVDNSHFSVRMDLRWCAIQILMVVLKASDMGIESFGLGADQAFTCFLRFLRTLCFFFGYGLLDFMMTTCYAFRWKEFCTGTSLEKASLYLHTEEGNSKTDVDGLTCLADTLSDWPEVAMEREHSIGSNIWCEHFFIFPLFYVSRCIFFFSKMILVVFILLILILNCFSLLVRLCSLLL